MIRSSRTALTLALGLVLAASTARADGLRFVQMLRNGDAIDGLDGARGMAMSPDGKSLYTVSKVDDAVDVFSRNPTTGALAFVEVHKHAAAGDGLNSVVAVSVSPDGKNVYVASYGDDALLAFSRDTDTGALTFLQLKQDGVSDGVSKVNGLDGAEAIALSPDGKFIYVAATNDNAVSVFGRDPNTGLMTFVEFHKPTAGGDQGLLGARGVSVSPDGRHVYVAGASEDAVAIFDRDAVTGKLTYSDVVRDQQNGVDGLDKARAVAMSADGANLYVAGGLSDAVAVFSRNATTGALTYLEVMRDNTDGVNGLNAANTIAVSPDGLHLYVTGDVDDSLATFGRDPATGRLTFVSREHDGVRGADGLNNADGVVVSPDNRHIYAIGFVDDAVALFVPRLCGDSVVDPDEKCDDGNTLNGDCCSSTCQYEALGATCAEDGNVCTTDACSAKGVCLHTPNTNPCDDGAFCTVNDVCGGGVCGGAARDCSGAVVGDQCHTGVCNEATDSCVLGPKPDGTACNDGQLCTSSDVCTAGTCQGSAVVCNPQDTCHSAGTCNPSNGVCSNPAKSDGASCSDGNACTLTDTCTTGVCHGASPVICTAQDQCHDAGSCNPTSGLCSQPAKPNGTLCNDASACTRTDTCQVGACVGGNPVVCLASDTCHDAGACNPGNGVCSNPVKADGASCSDGDACTLTDACAAGVCHGGSPLVCTAQDQCHDAGTCNHTSGACSSPAKLDGSACNDGSACTRADTCHTGVCTGSDPVVCDVSDQCHQAGVCSASTGQCSAASKPDGTACDDGDASTISDVCTAGVCSGTVNQDTDADGIPDTLDVCPDVYDPAQADTDHDGVGDACQCTAPAPGRCVAGGGPTSTDCFAEFDSFGAVTLNPKHTAVLPLLRCKDGDPACDRDGKADGQCTFGVSLCFANGDPRLHCQLTDVRSLEILSPKPDKAKSLVDRANVAAIERTTGAMGLEIRRGSRIVTALASPASHDACSPLVNLTVSAPTGKKPSRRIFKLRTTATDGRTDIDRLTLECNR